MRQRPATWLPILSLAVAGCGLGGLVLETEPWDPPPRAAAPAEPLPRAACTSRVPGRQPLYGDLHVHTGLSMDARAQGTETSPDDAYRFARGEAIERPVCTWRSP